MVRRCDRAVLARTGLTGYTRPPAPMITNSLHLHANCSHARCTDSLDHELPSQDGFAELTELACTTGVNANAVREPLVGDRRGEVDVELDVSPHPDEARHGAEGRVESSGDAIIDQLPIAALGLPIRATNPLLRAGIRTIGQLRRLSDTELGAVRNLGPAAIASIRNALNDPRSLLEGAPGAPVQECLDPRLALRSLTPQVRQLPIDYPHLPSKLLQSLEGAGITVLGDLVDRPAEPEVRDPRIYDVLHAVLAALARALTDEGTVDWPVYWQSRGIRVLPGAYTSPISKTDTLRHLRLAIEDVLRAIPDDDRSWHIIRHRWGLGGAPRLTLKDLGENALQITPERVRQVEAAALAELRTCLVEGRFSGRTYRIHPAALAEFARPMREVTDTPGGSAREDELATRLDRVGAYAGQLSPELGLLFELGGLRRMTFGSPSLVPIWTTRSRESADGLACTIGRIHVLLTKDEPLGLEEVELLVRFNQDLPRAERITLATLRECLPLCSTIEKDPAGRYFARFEYLQGRGNQVERILTEANRALALAEIARQINARTVPHGGRKVQLTNLSNQLSNDGRFEPVGRSGRWKLRAWQDVRTETIVDLMEQFLIERNSPASASDILAHVSALRPVSPSSISTYLHDQPIFIRMGAAGWGLAAWAQSREMRDLRMEQARVRRKRVRRAPTLFDQVSDRVRELLEAQADHQLPLADVIDTLSKDFARPIPTFYQYLSKLDFLEYAPLPGRGKICRLKDLPTPARMSGTLAA